MPLNRREFLATVAAGVAAEAIVPTLQAEPVGRPQTKALAFDAFPIFDPRPVFALAERLYPERGAELGNAWRTRQFEYQWLRTIAGHYADFWQATEDALVFSAKMLKLDLTAEKRDQLMGAYLDLDAWPDVAPALRTLSGAGIRLAFVSNATQRILEAGIKKAQLQGMFEHVLSTDAIKTYKPDPRAYQMAIDAFGLRREDIAFVAFAGWDAAGAKWFGYRTFWVNRLALPAEELGITPDGMGRDLAGVVSFLNGAGK